MNFLETLKKVNEELDIETYSRTASKLSDLGHRKRSNRMRQHILDKDTISNLTLPINYDGNEYITVLDDVDVIVGARSSSEEYEEPEITIQINNIGIFIEYHIYSNGIEFKDDRKLDDRKSATNLIKLLKTKINNKLVKTSKLWVRDRRILHDTLKKLTPNLFYQD